MAACYSSSCKHRLDATPKISSTTGCYSKLVSRHLLKALHGSDPFQVARSAAVCLGILRWSRRMKSIESHGDSTSLYELREI